MFNDYQSLIYVEKDNYQLETNGPHWYHYGNYLNDVNIQIESSNIVDCSFTLGMIYIPALSFKTGYD